jgi:hypothetical protein
LEIKKREDYFEWKRGGMVGRRVDWLNGKCVGGG